MDIFHLFQMLIVGGLAICILLLIVDFVINSSLDQVMADRGFKIHDLLSFYQCSLAIPPSKHANLQMSTSDVQKTSLIANVRIYIE